MTRLQFLLFLSLFLSLFAAVACNNVDRRLVVESDPPGALVYLNDQEVGRTPMDKEFVWYGTYDLQLRKEGYETVRATPRVWAPIWQWPPFDLLAELSPFVLTDRHRLSYEMRPLEQADPQELVARAQEMREQLQSSEYREPGEPAAITPEQAGSTRPQDESQMRETGGGDEDGLMDDPDRTPG